MNKDGNLIKSSLNSYKCDVYSQSGEDGIIQEILSRLSTEKLTDQWCVEFGAWDGIHHSNTCRLIKEDQYQAVLIEGDPQKYIQLTSNFPEEKVIKLCRFVMIEGESSLDSILGETPIPEKFDFLSIDIDGNDFYIFQSLTGYQPKVVSVEYNATIPNEVEYVQPLDFSIKRGASALAIIKLAQTKGYCLAAITRLNLIFIHADYKELIFVTDPPTLEQLRDDSPFKTFIFFGYDGTVLTNQEEIELVWHGLKISPLELQILPRFLRKFPADYNLFEKLMLMSWLLYKQPHIAMRRLKKRIFGVHLNE